MLTPKGKQARKFSTKHPYLDKSFRSQCQTIVGHNNRAEKQFLFTRKSHKPHHYHHHLRSYWLCTFFQNEAAGSCKAAVFSRDRFQLD